MREIKYRFYSKELEEFIVIKEIGVDTDGSWWYLKCTDDEQPPYNLSEIEVLQYTGLRDVNGREIYEGDVVKWGHTGEYFKETPHRIAVVQFNPDIQYRIVNFKVRGRELVFRHGNFNYANQTDEALEIIGNIYENPELI